VTQRELEQFLSEFMAERLALVDRHVAGARVVGHYDFNNTYQYIIAREETHLAWLAAALADCGADVPPAGPAIPVPAVGKVSAADTTSAYRDVLADDARRLGACIDAWRPRVAGLDHARNRKMLEVVLGEASEHRRLFEQAAGGFEDVLGRRTGGVARQGTVLAKRWQE
jgi:hypothetical protein